MTCSSRCASVTVKVGSKRDLCRHDDFSAPRQRLSVDALHPADGTGPTHGFKSLKPRALSLRANGCYNARSGGQFAASNDHRTPMRAPNERAAAVTRNTERSGIERTDWNAVTHPGSDAVYNDEVFSYFLEIERHRSRVSGQPFLLLVITLDDEPAAGVIPSETAENVFAALSASIRDTDFVGWYSNGNAIGAVLIQSVDFSKVDATGLVSARLAAALARRLPEGLVERLRFRLCQIAAEREVWS